MIKKKFNLIALTNLIFKILEIYNIKIIKKLGSLTHWTKSKNWSEGKKKARPKSMAWQNNLKRSIIKKILFLFNSF